MFFQYGEERINIDLIKSYKPEYKKEGHNILLKFLDDTEKTLYFFNREEDRDKFLSFLDENLLTSSE